MEVTNVKNQMPTGIKEGFIDSSKNVHNNIFVSDSEGNFLYSVIKQSVITNPNPDEAVKNKGWQLPHTKVANNLEKSFYLCFGLTSGTQYLSFLFDTTARIKAEAPFVDFVKGKQLYYDGSHARVVSRDVPLFKDSYGSSEMKTIRNFLSVLYQMIYSSSKGYSDLTLTQAAISSFGDGTGEASNGYTYSVAYWESVINNLLKGYTAGEARTILDIIMRSKAVDIPSTNTQELQFTISDDKLYYKTWLELIIRDMDSATPSGLFPENAFGRLRDVQFSSEAGKTDQIIVDGTHNDLKSIEIINSALGDAFGELGFTLIDCGFLIFVQSIESGYSFYKALPNIPIKEDLAILFNQLGIKSLHSLSVSTNSKVPYETSSFPDVRKFVKRMTGILLFGRTKLIEVYDSSGNRDTKILRTYLSNLKLFETTMDNYIGEQLPYIIRNMINGFIGRFVAPSPTGSATNYYGLWSQDNFMDGVESGLNIVYDKFYQALRMKIEANPVFDTHPYFTTSGTSTEWRSVMIDLISGYFLPKLYNPTQKSNIMLKIGRAITEKRSNVEFSFYVSTTNSKNPLFDNGYFTMSMPMWMFSISDLISISNSFLYTYSNTEQIGTIPRITTADKFHEIADYLPLIYRDVYNYFSNYRASNGDHVSFIVHFKKSSGAGLPMSADIGNGRIPKELLGDNILNRAPTKISFSTSDADLQNTVLNLLYYMVKYRATLMIHEISGGERKVALIASPTGFLDLNSAGVSGGVQIHHTTTPSWYASVNYNQLRESSRNDFLPVGLDLPFYSFLEANTDVKNKNSFEYWFTRWVLTKFNVDFNRLQLEGGGY